MKKVRVNTLLPLALAVATLSCGGNSSRQEAETEAGAAPRSTVFRLGFLPSQQADELIPDARRLGKFLQARMGVPVEVVVPATYEPLIEGLRFGHLHAAFLDGGPAWIAHRRTGAEVVLAEVNDGTTWYWAEAFCRTDVPLERLDQLPGLRLAFTSRTGSSGFLMPVGTLIQEGIIRLQGQELIHLEQGLRETFAALIYAGGYRQALQTLLDGRADVAFGAHDAPERFLEIEERGRIRSFHRFGRIPSHAVMMAPGVDSDWASRFVEAMLALNEPAHLPLLRAIYGVDGLAAAETEDHLGDFGRALDGLPGLERTLLERVR
jgi:phosphonate transport system substrate-binding protein